MTRSVIMADDNFNNKADDDQDLYCYDGVDYNL